MKTKMVSQAIQQTKNFLTTNSSTILTWCAVAGTISTAIFTAKSTIKAINVLEDEPYEFFDSGKNNKLNNKDKIKYNIKKTWKYFIPPVISGGVTIACILGSNSLNAKKTAVLSSLYSASELALKQYQEKVVEIVGQNKATQIKDEIARDKLKRNPKTDSQVIITGKGETLCFDSLSGRYFKIDIEKLRQVEHNINKRFLTGDDFVTVNELYYELGLDEIELGDGVGWDIDNELHFIFSSDLADDNTPCLVIDCKIIPKYKK